MKVKDIMTENPVCCHPETLLKDVVKMMVDADCGAIPVVDDNSKIVGILTDRDIIVRVSDEGKSLFEATAEQTMTKEIYSISPNDTVEDCCKLMETNQIRRVIVTDKDGECCGIVAQADIAFYGSKQQIADLVREISKANI